MKSLPPSSKVLLSFGEIDCRIDEGFLHASQKFGINIENLIEETVTNFVKWFAESNKNLNHNLNFFNVPAPIYNPKFSKNLNHKRSHTIKIFNRRLSETVKCQGFNLIDVYSATTKNDGFSNNLYHCDEYHLSNTFLRELNSLLSKLIGI